MTFAQAKVMDWLEVDPGTTSSEIESAIHDAVLSRLRRKGVVVGLSGGIDSSVVAALCVRALGRERVMGLMMPERECSEDSLRLGVMLADFLQIRTTAENITRTLEAVGCYQRRDDAIRRLVPGFDSHHKCKLVMADLTSGARYSIPSLVVEFPDGTSGRIRLNADTYLDIVAASNFKQRVRAMLAYYHADRLQYAVAGTPNRLEFDQGFFVKNGDSAADFKPIAHLYKSQVQQLAEYFDLPADILGRAPTTDTFSLAQSQEEFYFAVPLRAFDLCLYGRNHGFAPQDVAPRADLTCEQVQAVYDAIDSKRRATAYLHQPPILVEAITQIIHV